MRAHLRRLTILAASLSVLDALGQATAKADLHTSPIPGSQIAAPFYIHDHEVALYTLLLFLATLVVAAIALFQEHIKRYFFHAKLVISTSTSPPTCVMVPTCYKDSTREAWGDGLYLGLWVKNEGNEPAHDVEVFGNELRRLRMDNTWEVVSLFPPMNLLWANLGMPALDVSPGARRRLDVGSIIDPSRRADLGLDADHLEKGRTALRLATIVTPNHKGNIVTYGDYELDVEVSARNFHATRHTLSIRLSGTWYPNEEQMLSDGVAISVKAGTR